VGATCTIAVTDWATAITIILTALAVLLTAVAIMVGVVAIWGFASLKDEAKKIATQAATDEAHKTAVQVATEAVRAATRGVWSDAQATAMIEGQAEGLEHGPFAHPEREQRTKATTDKNLRQGQ